MKKQKKSLEKLSKDVKKSSHDRIGQYDKNVPAIISRAGNDISPEQMMMENIKQGASVETLERLFNLRERLNKEKAERAFREAMVQFQAQCPIIEKKRVVPEKQDKTKVRYKYAAIEDIMAIAQPHLTANKLSVKVDAVILSEPPAVQAIAKIYHTAGHSEESTFTIQVDPEAFMNDQQKWASALTFASRYALRNALGIFIKGEDKDASDLDTETPEQKKKREDAEKKLSELPEYIQKGFKILGYNQKTVFQFCTDRKWDVEKIKTDIDKAVEGRK